MMTDREYRDHERRLFHAQLREVETAPLSERRQGREDFAHALTERTHNGDLIVAERIGWLLAGNYGRGSYDAAREVISRPRMNQAAWLSQVIAALEWRCPAKFAAEAWKKLPPDAKRKLDREIKAEIASAKREG